MPSANQPRVALTGKTSAIHVGSSLNPPESGMHGWVQSVGLWSAEVKGHDLDYYESAEPLSMKSSGEIGFWWMTRKGPVSRIDAKVQVDPTVKMVPEFVERRIRGKGNYSALFVDGTGGPVKTAGDQWVRRHFVFDVPKGGWLGPNGVPYVYGVISRADNSAGFPEGVHLSVSNIEGVVDFSKERDSRDLYVKHHGRSIWMFCAKGVLGTRFRISIAAWPGTLFTFEIQTVPFIEPTNGGRFGDPLPTVLSAIYDSLDQANAAHFAEHRLATRDLSAEGLGTLGATLSVGGLALIGLNAAATVGTGGALLVPELFAAFFMSYTGSLLFYEAYLRSAEKLSVSEFIAKLANTGNLVPQGKVTVYVWSFRGINVAWGHAAVEADGTYMSWWPGSPRNPKLPVRDLGQLDNAYSAPPVLPRTLEDDKDSERDNPSDDPVPPDYKIQINNLDANAIQVWWSNFQHHHNWENLGNNCSKVSYLALVAGGANRVLTPRELANFESIAVWTPNDLLEFAKAIAVKSL